MQPDYRICSRCIMDTSDPDIFFDEKGVCNHCTEYEKIIKEEGWNDSRREEKLQEIIRDIRQNGLGNKYDCIIGLSGGVDSTYLAWLVKKKFGLRPLAVHFDNGWDSELAVKNIENIVTRLEIDLYTYVVDWEEFKNLQLAYLRASVIDAEVPTDHLIFAVLYRLAKENKIKYLLPGSNLATEAVLPNAWIFHRKFDLVNLENIHRQFGSGKLKNIPTLGYWSRFYYRNVYKLKSVNLLNYISYDKAEVKKFIQKELDWKDYGGKHYESVFTRFYQGYILPVKFGVDKRRAHLSNLICSGQMNRDEALAEIQKSAYDPEQLRIDKEFVIKKFGLSPEEFEQIMNSPVRKHEEFQVETPLYDKFPGARILKPAGDIIKKILSIS